MIPPPSQRISEITSRENDRLKIARNVRDGRIRGQIFLEGLRLCEELRTTALDIDSVFATPDMIASQRGSDFVNYLETKSARVFQVSASLLSTIAEAKNPQGIIAIAEKPYSGEFDLAEKAKGNFPIILLLHMINNPANLGAILRTAEASGVSGIITTKNSTNVFSPKSIRGSMGACLRLPVWENVDFFDAIEWSKRYQLKSVCADTRSCRSYLEIDWKTSKLLIFGSEGHGLTAEEIAATDENLLIPMENSVESLNVAVACGVILFEAKRQRSQ